MGFQQVVEFKAVDSSFSQVSEQAAQSVSKSFDKASESVKRVNDELANTATTFSDKLLETEREGEAIFKNLLQQSKEHGKTVQERVKWLKEELETMRRINNQYTVQERLKARMDYEEGMKRAAGMGGYRGLVEKQQVAKRYRDSIGQLKSDEDRASLMRMHTENEFHGWKSSASEGGGSGMGKVLGGAASMLGTAGKAAAGALGFGAALGFAGIISKMFTEGRREHEGIAGMRGLGLGGGISNFLGMSRAEMIDYTRGVGVSSGFASNAGARARMQYGTERAFGLESGSLNTLSGSLRMEGQGRDTASVVGEMLGIFKKSGLFNIDKGDFTQLGEKIDFLNTLNLLQGQQLDQINSGSSASMISAFGRAGVTDQRLMAYVNPINQSITNPRSAFDQAIIYRALSRANPNSSLLDIQRMQEQGAFGQGNINAILGEYKQNFSGDMLTRSVASGLGLKIFQAEKLLKGDFSVMDEQGEDVSMAEIMKKANQNTTKLSETMAEFNTWLGEKGVKMITSIESLVTAFEEGGLMGLLGELKTEIVAGFTSVVKALLGDDSEAPPEGASGLVKASYANRFAAPYKAWVMDTFGGEGGGSVKMPEGMKIANRMDVMWSNSSDIQLQRGNQKAWIQGLNEDALYSMTPEQWKELFAEALVDADKKITEKELRVIIAGSDILNENIIHNGTTEK